MAAGEYDEGTELGIEDPQQRIKHLKRNAVIPNYSIFGGGEKIESDEITAYFLQERFSCKKSITTSDEMPVTATVFDCPTMMETVGEWHPFVVPQPSKTQWE